MNPRSRPWLISSAATIAVLLLVEAAFRVAGDALWRPEDLITELDAYRLTRNRACLSLRASPWNVPVTTNRFGFRGPEIPVEKAPGVYRIAVLGDSSTFGAGVGDDETFCAKAEGLLNGDSGRLRYEVINAGVIGYGTMQGLRTLDRAVLPLRPDALVVSFAVNDATPGGSLRDFMGRRRPPAGTMAAAVVWVRNLLWNNSFACRWVLRAGLGRLRDLSDDRVRAAGAEAGWRPESSAEYRRNLREFITIARSNGMDLVFLPMPVRLKQTRYPLWGGQCPAGNRQECRDSLRRVEKTIARTRGRADISAMHYYAGRLHEALGERRPALESYLKAMSFSGSLADLRWGAYSYANLMGETAVEERVPLANVLPAFYMRELADNPPELYVDAYHPGWLGHGIVAEALAVTFRDLVRRRPARRGGKG